MDILGNLRFDAGIARPTTTCPARKLAVGGGFDPALANSHELVGTHPTAYGIGWTTMNDDGFFEMGGGTLYAVCLAAS